MLLAGSGAAPASAVAVMRVPCDASALASAIAGASSGAALQLAGNCTYLLTAALPTITTRLTLAGTGNYTTIERSHAGGTPALSLLTTDSGAHLTVNGVNFSNGDTTDAGGALDIEGGGDLTVIAGSVTGCAG